MGYTNVFWNVRVDIYNTLPPEKIFHLLVFCEFVWNFLNFNFFKKYVFLYIKACLFYLCKLVTHGKKYEQKFLSSADIAGGSLFKSLEWSFM